MALLNSFSEIKFILSYYLPSKNKEKRILVDVGAHEGGFTREFYDLGWRVLAFEPEENNRQVFLSKFDQNDKIQCVPKAVTDVSGNRIPFYTSEKHYGIHSIKPFHETHQSASYEVETITLKDALNENNIDHVSFLKVDTEGADFLALKGFDWDKSKPELVMVEFMDDRSMKNFGYTHHDMAKYMAEKGYTCFVSEWEAIKSYGIKGQISEPHQWVQCIKYPLDHEPSWGNLIFVPAKDVGKFERNLKKYLKYLKKGKNQNTFKYLIFRLKVFIKQKLLRKI